MRKAKSGHWMLPISRFSTAASSGGITLNTSETTAASSSSAAAAEPDVQPRNTRARTSEPASSSSSLPMLRDAHNWEL